MKTQTCNFLRVLIHNIIYTNKYFFSHFISYILIVIYTTLIIPVTLHYNSFHKIPDTVIKCSISNHSNQLINK
jgi:hypothetical protein